LCFSKFSIITLFFVLFFLLLQQEERANLCAKSPFFFISVTSLLWSYSIFFKGHTARTLVRCNPSLMRQF